MTAVTPAAPGPIDEDAILVYSRADSGNRLSRRDATGLVAMLFMVVAGGMLALPSHRPFSFAALLVCLFCYSLSARVQFEFGGVFAVPTQTVFVAMWFLLPLRMLPVVVCAGLLLAQVPDFARKRPPLERVTIFVASSWFTIGPALVLYLGADGSPRWRLAPVYVAALASQFVCDYVSVFLCYRKVFGISPRAQLRSLLPVYAVDSMLAPLGLLVAFPARHQPLALMLVLPVLLLFATFAKERQRRLDNALELSTAYRGTAMLLGDVIEADDAYTGSHSRDVVDLVVSVADRLGLSARDRQRAEFAALLHDVGKVKIPSAIINKAGPLDDAEWEIMKTHTVVGERMLERIGGLLGEVGQIVRSCHERWDGGGYPDGLAGDEIPLAARIVCACDAWSAMTTDRSYRQARSAAEAADELRGCAGTHFDADVVDALLAVLAH
jgi:HD-GYP domain-containing protein (c-di-GMP phosphodiesterase class II)